MRCFATRTEDLHAAADWLKACHIEMVAMESTGVYWILCFRSWRRGDSGSFGLVRVRTDFLPRMLYLRECSSSKYYPEIPCVVAKSLIGKYQRNPK